LLGAILLFLAMWALKNLPVIKKLLTTDRRKLLANALLAMTPAVILLIDASISGQDAWYEAISIFLSAMGIQGGSKALAGDRLKGILRLGEQLVEAVTDEESKADKDEDKPQREPEPAPEKKPDSEAEPEKKIDAEESDAEESDPGPVVTISGDKDD
jgi:hypothetical protein